jgi:tetratricopeptide (TPR) repeat protein
MSSELLRQAITAIRSGNKTSGARKLAQLVKQDPNNETAWLWLSVCVESAEQKRYCLNRVLGINPTNREARQALAQLEPVELPSMSDIVPPSTKRVASPVEVPAPHITSSATNAVTNIIIVLLVILGLFWLGIGILQLSLGLGNNPYVNTADMLCAGGWNLFVSVINLGSIADVVRRYRRTVRNLTLLAVLGSLWGLYQILEGGAWLQVLVVPVYIALGVLAQVNRSHFTALTLKELEKQKRKQRARDFSSVISSLVAEIDPDDLKQDAQYYYKQGMRLMKVKRFSAAADEFAKVLHLAPDGTKWNKAAQARLSELYRRQIIE